MLKRRSKHFALLLVLTMLATMFIGVGTASAYSINRVDKVVSVDDDYTGAPSTLTIKEDSDYAGDFVAGDSFMITLPAGVNWDAATVTVEMDNDLGTVTNYDMIAGGDAVISSDQILDITFPATVAANAVETITIALGIEVESFSEGDITATIDALDSGVTAGKYVFARVLDGTTKATALSVETIGEAGDNGGDVRLEENALNAVGAAAQEIEFKLPSHFDWDVTDAAGAGAGDVDSLFAFSGGFAGLTFTENATTATIADGQWNATVADDTITLIIDPAAARTQRGIITMDTPINPDKDANFGDVEVNVSGDEVDDADVIVAKYADYGVDVTIDEVEDVIAGKYNQELDTITIEENVPGTLIQNRDITFEFPSWVKITDVAARDSGGTFAVTAPTVLANTGDVDGTSNELDITIATASSGGTVGKLEVDFEISVEGNKSGDIELIISSKNGGLTETKLVVGKAVCPVSAESAGSKDIKIGLQAQELSDITITENIKEAATDDVNGSLAENIFVTLPQGAKFASKPTVEVIEGNIDIDEDAIDLVDFVGTDDRLSIPVTSSSSKASKIKVSGIKVTVDRTVPEGDFSVSIGGGSLIENQRGNGSGWLNGAIVGGVNTDIDEGEFDTGTAAKVLAAKVVTPAPGEVSNAASFVIGTATYKLNGVDQTMDVAPYIKDSRTYMPIRYVAYALGISDANILWDGANQTVTLMKEDKVVQLKVGSNSILINGAAVAMDVAPEITNSRTMLPISFVANAFGATASWDAATQTVSIK